MKQGADKVEVVSTQLEFTPLEFETRMHNLIIKNMQLEFTPLEFETLRGRVKPTLASKLEFTPLEFETTLKT